MWFVVRWANLVVVVVKKGRTELRFHPLRPSSYELNELTFATSETWRYAIRPQPG